MSLLAPPLAFSGSVCGTEVVVEGTGFRDARLVVVGLGVGRDTGGFETVVAVGVGCVGSLLTGLDTVGIRALGSPGFVFADEPTTVDETGNWISAGLSINLGADIGGGRIEPARGRCAAGTHDTPRNPRTKVAK